MILLWCFLVLVVCASVMVVGQSTPVVIDNWFQDDIQVRERSLGSVNIGDWVPGDRNESVMQVVNGGLTFYCSDFSAMGAKTEDVITPTVTGTSDKIGFALGFRQCDTTNPNADYLLLDWQRRNDAANWRYDDDGVFNNQACTQGTTTLEGLALLRVQGIATPNEFWGLTNDEPTEQCALLGQGGVQLLQRGNLYGQTGWESNVNYCIHFEFSPTSIRIFVTTNGQFDNNLGVPEFKQTGLFSNASLCFYNFSEERVRYSGFDIDTNFFSVLPMASSTTFPMATPTFFPTFFPTPSNVVPNPPPTALPTALPTAIPTARPMSSPTIPPTSIPTVTPTATHTATPTATPTATAVPTLSCIPTTWPIFPTLHPQAVPDKQGLL